MEAELTALVSARLFSLVDSYTPWSVCFSHVALVGNKEGEKDGSGSGSGSGSRVPSKNWIALQYIS
jgi:hypothetical protein